MGTASHGSNTHPGIHLKLRIGHGKDRRFVEPAYDPKTKKLKPHCCFVDGLEECHPDGVYYVRLGGKEWGRIGVDPADAEVEILKRNARANAQALGIALLEPAPQQAPISDTNFKSQVNDYLTYVKEHKSDKTYKAYSHADNLFAAQCPALTIQAITRQQLLDHISYLRNEVQLEPRTVFNHYAFIGIMMRSFGVNPSDMLKPNERPKYEEPIPDAYTDEDLLNLFAECTEEEALTFEFFLESGFREQEVEYTTWPDIDKGGKVVKARKKTGLKFRVKDNEGREVPVPDRLIDRLVERRKNSYGMFVFAAPRGGTQGHFLRMLKQIAFRAGLNCGFCRNKPGLSCKDHPVCEYWNLHKFRRTFATMHHEKGAGVCTIQAWLGHEDLATTLRYIAISDRRSPKTRERVNGTFDWLQCRKQPLAKPSQT